jgi:hypothetical protein
MSNVAALNFKQELANAEAVAAQKKAELDAVPELSTEEILAGFTRELREVKVAGFGKVYYYHPMSVAEHLELQSRLDGDGATTAANLVQTIIALARSSDGSPKFKAEHAQALIDAPSASIFKLASTMMGSHVALASAEKK